MSFDAKKHCIAASCTMHAALSLHEHFQKIDNGSTNDNEIIREIIQSNHKATSDESVLNND